MLSIITLQRNFLPVSEFSFHVFWITVVFSVVFPCLSFSSSTDTPSPTQLQPEKLEKPEIITLNGIDYLIPEPWAGNRLDPPRFEYSSFRQIPGEHSWNNSKIYIVVKAHVALIEMLAEAEEDGITLKVESGYRSERYQKSIFKRMIAKGRTFDDIVRYVAPPGYSGHAFGTAVDFYPSNWRFADTPDYKWLQENGARFNFEETYFRTNALKMPWEAWHWNYIGE